MIFFKMLDEFAPNVPLFHGEGSIRARRRQRFFTAKAAFVYGEDSVREFSAAC